MAIKANRAEWRQRVLDIVNTPPPEDMEDCYLDLHEAFEATVKRGMSNKPGYKFPGFENISECTGGIRERGVTLICGPTGAGKTTLMANLWAQCIILNLPTWTAAVETGKEDFLEILVSIYTGKNRNKMSAEDWRLARLEVGKKHFSDRRHVFSNNESRVNHIDLLTEIYYAHMTKGTKIAFADNWQFMLDVGRGDDIAQNDKALHEVVVFFKHVPIHFFLVMHPKKTEDGRVNSKYDIKGSSTSVQEAHNIWLFNKLKDVKDTPPMTISELCREITIAKSRYNGRTEGEKIVLHLDSVSETYKEYKML